MTDINIRRMTAEDIPKATEIHRSILSDGESDGLRYSVSDMFVSYITVSPDTCFVAESGGEMVGFIIGSVREWNFGVEKAGWIEIIGVDQLQMGAGVGKALGDALIAHFRGRGINCIYTTVMWDSGDLISFFKSLGFMKSDFVNLELSECKEGD